MSTVIHHRRFPTFCDRCDSVLELYRYVSFERETVAGSFKYSLCHDCYRKLQKSNKQARNRAYVGAMVKRAARYSPDYAAFVATWFGMPGKAVHS